MIPDGTASLDPRREQCHNSLIAKSMGRSVLTSGQLGLHNGLPCTIIVSATLQELEYPGTGRR
jgi:hypothetical protein